MRRIITALLVTYLMIAFGSLCFANDGDIELNAFEIEWLNTYDGETLYLGLDPYSGMDYFEHRGENKGYVIELVKLIEESLGINIEIVGDKSWGEVYSGLETGTIDILFGANETPERLKWMSFTKPVHRYPYATFSLKNSVIQTMGDLDGRKLGIISGDIVKEILPGEYPNIEFDIAEYEEQLDGIAALLNGEIDGFITSGGGVVYEFLFEYENLRNIATIESITSDMTLSTRLEDGTLAGLLSKVIEKYRDSEIEAYIASAQIDYNRKILNLSEEELKWLKEDGRAVVGIADDYLPFDYYEEGRYLGITGALLEELSNMVGIQFDVKNGSFSEMYEQALLGEVDVMNIAKTEARSAHFIYPRAYSNERDIIVGKKSSDRVQDVYGLNGKKIAVVEGYWHEEFITKNLKDVEIIITKDLLESLKIVRNGTADYMIENPTVLEYYIDGLGYTDIVKKGVTSKDSYLYLGVSNTNEELASIIDKALLIIDYEKVKFKGIDSSPVIRNEQNIRLLLLVGLLLITLFVILILLRKIFMDLIAEKAHTELLKEREHLIYTDALTTLSNRMHFNHLERTFDDMQFPQCVFITDLNNLKDSNDNYGHHLGDALLETFANVLKDNCGTEFVFRMGGDEFMFIKHGCSVESAKQLIHQIESECSKSEVQIDGSIFNGPQAAFGFSIRHNKETTLESVIVEADNDMYRHKALLKGRPKA